ncbi:60S ribosomal protein L12, partial [Galemys pyrenaicus]
RGSHREVGTKFSLAPKIGNLDLSPQKVSDDFSKATSDWKDLRMTAKICMAGRMAQEQGTAKSQKEAGKHQAQRNCLFDETVIIAPCGSALNSLAPLTRSWGHQSPGATMWTGGLYPVSFVDDLNSGKVECPAS